ncbi:hypothetical protein UFOVP1666_1 [uncultured Caudovirales phage]|uniref:Uncharacterized protein n=1 Tax=uncultured Caudovirales phage TaxID=2100421 RepID=A0A6J5PG45_9CAUD|nr:hypothetical protein UFOVP867_154 [uncultured Caudovirales phage]CAB4170526.1 hypothetical protein UFOVP913_44 [uncultured Caudovirales phage]CAB4176953.1 hypothetical protein UFOVP993_97 [uncultured Caudovirales phage]CAB4222937.1 hypothetical protein UFOVP1666_1 [uncultured Caudovirales phage]
MTLVQRVVLNIVIVVSTFMALLSLGTILLHYLTWQQMWFGVVASMMTWSIYFCVSMILWENNYRKEQDLKQSK